MIPSTTVPMGKLADEFDSPSCKLSDFYKSGANVSSLQGNSTVDIRPLPSTGEISLGMFRGLNNDGLTAETAGRSAKQIKRATGTTTDGLYWIRVDNNASPVQVWCDMNTDGGGWMLVARTHPSPEPSSWGWKAPTTGAPTDFSQPYNLGWSQYSAGGAFSEMLVGNRKNINNNEWGPFIYKRTIASSSLMSINDMIWAQSTTIKYDLTVYETDATPGMQTQLGFADSGTANKFFYMRDCCGFASYGVHYYGMFTTYVNHETLWHYAGPWALNTYNVTTGDFDQHSGNTRYGGTRHVMIMVR